MMHEGERMRRETLKFQNCELSSNFERLRQKRMSTQPDTARKTINAKSMIVLFRVKSQIFAKFNGIKFRWIIGFFYTRNPQFSLTSMHYKPLKVITHHRNVCLMPFMLEKNYFKLWNVFLKFELSIGKLLNKWNIVARHGFEPSNRLKWAQQLIRFYVLTF
jgi:hypothetical protein